MQLVRKIPKRILGIDYGMARIGLAISDEHQIIALPLQTVQAEKKEELTVFKLSKLIADLESSYGCEFEELVIGLPLMMSGHLGPIAIQVKNFVVLLSKIVTIPIKTWDERLTTAQAERTLTNMTRKKRAKVVDVVSAALILQGYLDHKKICSPELDSYTKQN